MKMKTVLVGFLAAILASHAFAQDSSTPPSADVLDATKPGLIAQALQELGYRAQLEIDSQGDPVIRTTFARSKTNIYFYSCTEGKDCEIIQFSAGFDKESGFDAASIIKWNRDRLFGSAYLDDEDDPWVKLTVNLKGGVTEDNLKDTIEWWEVVVGQFRDHIDF